MVSHLELERNLKGESDGNMYSSQMKGKNVNVSGTLKNLNLQISCLKSFLERNSW